MDSEKVINETLGKTDKKSLEDLKKSSKPKEVEKKKGNSEGGFLDNPKAIRRVRSIILGAIVFFLPMIYFLVKDNLSLDTLFSWEMGGLMLITTIGTMINIGETKKTTFEDTIDSKTEISNDEITITQNGEKLSEKSVEAMPFLNDYNDKLQKMYDLQKTTKKISKLKRKIATISISLSYKKTQYFSKFLKIILIPVLLNKLAISRKTNRINRKNRKIEKLNATPLRDKKFKPYRIERLLRSRSSNRYTKIGDKQIRSAPDQIDVGQTAIKMPFKGLGMSLTGGAIPLIFGANFWTIFVFYIGYGLGQLFTTFSQYVMTKYKTTHEFREAQKEKIRLQTMLLTELAKPKVVEKPKEVEKPEEIVMVDERTQEKIIVTDKELIEKITKKDELLSLGMSEMVEEVKEKEN